ncbi:glycogen synthase GlgA [Castellaniella ginsengisoli]|uniref:Glycogen synthase n=1 Tax=Castellaniella ginsengisoli TaxID=546114 RepID=A0AB39CHR2_9BURK
MDLSILAVAAEAFPLAKTGGLGDAVSGLCRSLHHPGRSRVTLMLPAYRDALARAGSLRECARFPDLAGGPATLLAGVAPSLGLPVLLLRNDALYDRDGVYGDAGGNEYPDNALRFAALAQAAARVARGGGGAPRPDIVHAHDWHAALIPVYLKQMRTHDVRTMLTLHNIAFQGIFPLSLARALGIQPEFCGGGAGRAEPLNFLEAGIRHADLISVVSRNYAREILTPAFGCGLESVLAARAADTIAIANGIDMSIWDPQADEYLQGLNFGIDRMENKAACKRLLQESFGLAPDPRAAVLALGSRITGQKMADVAAQALPVALDGHPDLQVCILGRGEKRLESALQALAQRYPGRCAVQIGFRESQAHLLHAGADILLHGSRFEPFGLTPLYAMRYGTIPIGSRVGGMADTIRDAGSAEGFEPMREATGVLFEGDSIAEMAAAIDRALALWRRPAIWRAMQRNAMRTDFGWARAAPQYLRAYRALCPAHLPGAPVPAPADRVREGKRPWRPGLREHADTAWTTP